MLRCFFEIQFLCYRDHAHVVLPAGSNGHQCFEDLIRILAQSRSDGNPVQESFGRLVFMHLILDAFRLDDADGIGLMGIFLLVFL